MSVWKYSAVNDYTSILFTELSGNDLRKYFTGAKIDNWKNIWIHPSEESQKERIDVPDFVWHSLAQFIPIFSEKALDLLNPIISPYIQALPLRWYPDKKHKLYAINVINVIDCLDEDMSEFTIFSSGRRGAIRKHVFKQDCPDNAPIFKLTSNPNGIVYISECFVEKAKETGLRGLRFEDLDLVHDG